MDQNDNGMTFDIEQYIKEPTLAELIDQRYDIEQQKKELNREIKDLNEHASELDDQIFSLLSKTGLNKASGKRGTVTQKEQKYVSADTTRWDEIFEWVHTNKYFPLLRKQLNLGAAEELADMGELPEELVKLESKQSLSYSKASK